MLFWVFLLSVIGRWKRQSVAEGTTREKCIFCELCKKYRKLCNSYFAKKQ